MEGAWMALFSADLCFLDLIAMSAQVVGRIELTTPLTVHVSQLKLGLLRRLGGLFEPDPSDAGLACD